MLRVEQFRYGHDNLAYLVYGKKEALAIDGGASNDILHFLDRHGLVLSVVANTHDHFDHLPGNETLLRHTGASLLGFDDLPDGKVISLDGGGITVMRTPGHSHDSVCFYTGSAVLSGDTLFNGTIGNCFTGDLAGFYRSIKRLMMLPPETLVYAGHDYVRDSLAFGAALEPGNGDIERFRRAYDPQHVCSSLAEELKINPYLRFNEEPIVDLLKRKGLPLATEWERWQSLMSIE
jgi:hydroxyacylglutathione hydrolase